MPLDLEKLSKQIDEALKNMTQEDIDKYFPSCARPKPKGWLSIEEYLPMWLAIDVAQGFSVYKVKDAAGSVFESAVSDHDTWYHMAKETGITHWLNE